MTSEGVFTDNATKFMTAARSEKATSERIATSGEASWGTWGCPCGRCWEFDTVFYLAFDWVYEISD